MRNILRCRRLAKFDISGTVRVAVLDGKPISLTLTLSHGEREQPAAASIVREVRRPDTALRVMKVSEGFQLSA